MAKGKCDINLLCKKCIKDCKQSSGVDIVNCKDYQPQLELRLKKKTVKRKKNGKPS